MHGLDSLLDLFRGGAAACGDADVRGVALWFLALVFAWSGSAKVRRPALAAIALVDFRLARRARVSAGRLVGLGEFALAASLGASAIIGTPFSILPLATVCAVLTGFTFLIGRALLASERFPCACFGNGETTLSKIALLRTGLLALLTGVVLAAAPGGSVIPAPRDAALQLVIAAGAIALLVHAAHVVALIRQIRAVLSPPVAAR